MAKSHAIRALEKKRARLKVDLERVEAVREEMIENIADIEAVMTLLTHKQPPSELNAVLRRWIFRRRELRRLILAIEAEKGEGLTHRQIAIEIVTQKGWAKADRDFVAMIAMKVKASRRLLRRNMCGNG